MLPLTYYFWNSYKKSGYVRGKLDRAEYDKQVSQQGKDSNVFVKKLVDNVLEDQEKTVKENITTLEIEVNNADKELKKIQMSKSEEENSVTETYINKKELLDQEKLRAEQEFADNSLLEMGQLKKAREILGNLSEFLGTYAEEVKKGVAGQGERLLSQWKSALKYNTKLTAQEIKDGISPKEVRQDNKDGGKGNNSKRSLGLFIILLIICLFDVFLGYLGIKKFLLGIIDNKRLAIALGLFLAAVLIPLAVSLVHFAVIAKEKGGATKQLGNITIIAVIFLLILYACQSVSASDWKSLTNEFSFGDLVNLMQGNPEFLLRCFILPSLFAGEIIIDLINRDAILDRFGIGKQKGTNSLSRLITNGLYFLKSRKISNYAKEEKKSIENLITEMQKEEVPAFVEVKKDISEIQSILDPVWNKQSQKVEEYNAKMADIKSKMDKLQSEYSSNLQGISDKYSKDITRFENLKRINEIKINKLNHDFNQASIDVKEGILLGLIDK